MQSGKAGQSLGGTGAWLGCTVLYLQRSTQGTKEKAGYGPDQQGLRETETDTGRARLDGAISDSVRLSKSFFVRVR